MSKVTCNYFIFPDDINYNLNKINQKGLNIFCLSQKFSKLRSYPKALFKEKNGDFFQYNVEINLH